MEGAAKIKQNYKEIHQTSTENYRKGRDNNMKMWRKRSKWKVRSSILGTFCNKVGVRREILTIFVPRVVERMVLKSTLGSFWGHLAKRAWLWATPGSRLEPKIHHASQIMQNVSKIQAKMVCATRRQGSRRGRGGCKPDRSAWRGP